MFGAQERSEKSRAAHDGLIAGGSAWGGANPARVDRNQVKPNAKGFSKDYFLIVQGREKPEGEGPGSRHHDIRHSGGDEK